MAQSLNPSTDADTRLLSLDALRGGVVALMLAVNHTWDASVFHKQFFHVPWNDPMQGATATDLVFPLFLFAAGASVPLSLRFGRGRERPWWRQLLSALRRGVILYLLGVLLTMAPAAYARPLVWADLFTWNILQLIGAAYVVAVALFLLPRWAQVTAVAAILLAKWGLMTLLPYEMVAEYGAQGATEGSPAGPGTWQHYHGVKGWINATLGWFGAAQQFLPAAAIAIFGGWGSEWLITRGQALRKSLLLSLVGTAIAALAIGLGYGYQAEGGGLLGTFTVPASKWFFSVSYCLLSAGVGLVLYAAFWLVCDGWKLTGLLPLRVFGLNAIVLYVGSGLTFNVIIRRWTTYRPDGETANLASSLIAWANHLSGTAWLGPYLWPTVWLGLWWLICWWMYRKSLFVRV